MTASCGGDNPYLITGPALISNSMGRTSGKMLHDILDAHDGQLPPDVYVVTANTGDEDPKSIRFRREQIARWNVPQIMVEYRNNDAGYEIVGDNSMSMCMSDLTDMAYFLALDRATSSCGDKLEGEGVARNAVPRWTDAEWRRLNAIIRKAITGDAPASLTDGQIDVLADAVTHALDDDNAVAFRTLTARTPQMGDK